MNVARVLSCAVLFFSSLSISAAGRAVKFKSDVIPLKAVATQDFSIDLKSLLADVGTGNLQWSAAADKPAWLTIDSPSQKMFGLPSLKDAGLKSFRLGVQDGDTGAFARIDLSIVIEPIWQPGPLNLGIQKENVPFTFDLKTKVTHPAGGVLTFAVARTRALPKWMSLATNGVLSGTPRRDDVGTYSGIVFTAKTESGGEAKTDAFGKVEKVVNGPKWTANPIVIDNANEDFPYSKDVSTFVVHTETSPLSYKLTQGAPSGWLKMGGTGSLFGTPGKVDLGDVAVKAEVSTVIDGVTYKDETTLRFKVNHTNHSPAWNSDPVVLPQAQPKKLYTQDLKGFATDPDGDKLTFKLSGTAPKWAAVSADGILSGTPQNANIGTNNFSVEVSDGEFSPSAIVQIVVVNRPPTWLKKPTVLPSGKEDALYSQSLIPHATDPDGDPLSFALVSGPSWATVTSAGVFSGTPKAADLGLQKFKVRVSDGAAGSDETEVQVTIDHVNHAPKWTQDPVLLPNAPEKVGYSVSLTNFVFDPDANDRLTITKVSGPAWASIDATGKLFGTPERSNVGLNEFKVRVQDLAGASAEATARVTVIQVNKEPVWLEDPILLGTLTEDTLFNLDLKTKATDPDGDVLTFKRLTGPTWVVVGTDGKLSATPPKGSLGQFSGVLEVSDGTAGKQATFKGVVIQKNYPPVINDPALDFSVKERQVFAQSLNDPKYVSDPNGDPLTFSLVEKRLDWLVLTETGALQLKPLFKDIGDYAVKFKVSDGKLETQGTIKIHVLRDPRAPVWLESPIRFEAREGQIFGADISGKAKDLDGLALTFSKKSGPSWLSVTAGGQLSGTPLTSNVGENTFAITAKNDLLGADNTILVTVSAKPNRPPVWIQDPITLTDATEGSNFQFDVSKFATDPDGDPLTFRKVSRANWISVSGGGLLTGTPAKADVGSYQVVLEVSDGRAAAQAKANGRVVAKNGAPIVKQPGAAFVVKERAVLTDTLNQIKYVEDPDGDKLTFTLLEVRRKAKSSFLTLASDGAVSLKPVHEDIGDYTFRFQVSDGALSAQGTFTVKVVADPRPPIWLEDPIRFQAQDGQSFSASLADKARDLDGLALTFSKKSGPAWLTVNGNGALSGTPATANVGENKFVVTVRNEALGADGNLVITVTAKPNRPPVWIQDPITLSDATEGVGYQFSLSSLATDPDGDPLTFKKVSRVDWLTVSPSGALSGTPLKEHIGTYTVIFEVSDGKATARATGKGRVLAGNHAPVWLEDPIRFEASQNLDFSNSIAAKAMDQDGDALTFSKKTGPAWLTVGSDGKISGRPPTLGIQDFTVSVTDGKASVDARLVLNVTSANRPPVWLEDPIRFEASQNVEFANSVAAKAMDQDGDPLTFSKKTGPAWLTIGMDGKLSGRPPALGINDFTVTVSDGKASADARLTLNVTAANRPPVWLEDPIRFEASAGNPFSNSIASKATDQDGDALTFSKKSGSSWLTVGTDGRISGQPTNANLGSNDFVVAVSDGKAAVEARLIVNVTIANKPPRWLKNPIPLGDYQVNLQGQFDLSVLATDDDGDALTFRKISGPAWTNVSGGGMFYGTPSSAQLGEFTMQIEVSDGRTPVVADAFGKVISTANKPPVIKPEALSFIIKENEVFRVNINQPKYVEDPEGDALTFQLLSSLPWGTLGSNGDLELRPLHPQLGDHTVPIRVTDSKGAASEGPMMIRVIANGNPPIWLQDPIRFEATVNQPFSASVKDKAHDPAGLVLEFSKLSGPGWMLVNQNGALAGTPLSANLGENSFRVSVRNTAGLSADATVIVTVKNGSIEHEDEIAIDKIVPGAPSENLWVVDNSWPWLEYNRLVRLLKEEIHTYFEELNQAQVRHTGIYLSSDNLRWGGNPVQGNDSSIFCRWDDSRLPEHFVSRIDETYNKKCSSSPIWAMHLFYQKVKGLSNIYHNGYFTEGVPMDVLVVTKHSDNFKSESKGTPYAGNTANDYADRFIKFHGDEKQPYRISAIAPDCQNMLDPTGEAPEQTSAENPYRTLVRRTSGQYFSWDCHFNMEKTLKEYAKQVAFRAHVSAKRRIPLSKVPSDVTSIKVFLAGQPLLSNQWSYDSARNEVTIQWQLIDLSKLKPGDLIEIRYKT